MLKPKTDIEIKEEFRLAKVRLLYRFIRDNKKVLEPQLFNLAHDMGFVTELGKTISIDLNNLVIQC